MPKLIFLNPTPNLLKVAEQVKAQGKSVRLAFNNQFPPISSTNLHVFKDGTYSTARKTPNPAEVPSELCMKMKKNVFNFFYAKTVKSKLSEFGNEAGNANITDLCLFKTCGVYSHEIKHIHDEPVTHQTLLSSNPDSLIVTSNIESLSGNEKMNMFDTDFCLKDAFGNDFFVVFAKQERIEVCVHGNRLITIGNKNSDHMQALGELFPMFKQFSFKKVKELVISRNRQPWAYKKAEKGVVLLNDFSYFNLSLRLPELWYQKAGKLLCSEKLR